MEDWQRWNREKAKKPPVQYLFFPNRTPGQTYFISVLMGCAIMGLTYMLFNTVDYKQKRNFKKTKINENPVHEQGVIIVRDSDKRRIQFQRQYLNLSSQPASSIIITDPDVNAVKGQLD